MMLLQMHHRSLFACCSRLQRCHAARGCSCLGRGAEAGPVMEAEVPGIASRRRTARRLDWLLLRLRCWYCCRRSVLCAGRGWVLICCCCCCAGTFSQRVVDRGVDAASNGKAKQRRGSYRSAHGSRLQVEVTLDLKESCLARTCIDACGVEAVDRNKDPPPKL